MADDRIKVIFDRVYVKDDSDSPGNGEFFFIANVGGQPVGNRHEFNAKERTWITLPEAQWSVIIDVRRKAQVVVRFQGKESDTISDDNLGTVTHTLRPPWQQRGFRVQTSNYLLEWRVELTDAGVFRPSGANTIFACREHNGSAQCTTISGRTLIGRMEFHPVIPLPTVGLPPRAPFPAGTGPQVAGPSIAGTIIAPGDPINIVPNPAVIPILSAPAPAAPAVAPALAANAPPRADATTAARIEFTYYRPGTLAFTDGDPRLEWTARSIVGGATVGFIGPPRGTKVLVYGKTAGEILLEVRFLGTLFATYRALVMAVKRIPCRCNILNGPTSASQPRATPTDVQNHLAIANRFLRQIALVLVADTNTTTSNGAVATAIPGIFRIAVGKATTWHIDSDVNNLLATRLNYRPGVMNFAYVHSERRHGQPLKPPLVGNHPVVGGAASDFPASTIAAPAGVRPTITDSGTPSTSWRVPTGIAPDAAAMTLTMTLITAIQRAGHPRLFAMFLCDTLGDPSTPAGHQNYAKSMAHELGHILNLGHRVEGPDPATASGTVANGIFDDGINYPPQENIMFWQGAQPICQDFDIIQARGAHASPLPQP